MSEFYKKLITLGLCTRCAFRYLGIRDPTLYEEDIVGRIRPIQCFKGEFLLTSILEEANLEPNLKIKRKNPCMVCMDLLVDLVEDNALEKICKTVSEADYDSPLITCAVSLPIAMQLRTHSLGLYLQTQDATFSVSRVVPIKEAWKWACLPRIAKNVGKEPASGTVCDFLVNIHVQYAEDKNECEALQKIHAETIDERKRWSRKFRGELFTRQSVEVLLSKTSDVAFLSVYQSPPEPPSEAVWYGKIECSQNALFIAGRYSKYSRELSQTPWLVEGERRIEGSVQEFITSQLEWFFNSKPGKFVASGREDVDVRTLGRGRPFAVELPDPRRTASNIDQLAQLQKEINKGCNHYISVRDLQVVQKDELTRLKEGEENKSKAYVAYCRVVDGTVNPEKLKALSTIKDLELSQKTPLRVLHRRPLAVRPRVVMSMRAVIVNDQHFRLHMRAQAGTYIKEFVHGDFGRTVPNLGTLLDTQIDILALDVEDVELDWPRPIVQHHCCLQL